MRKFGVMAALTLLTSLIGIGGQAPAGPSAGGISSDNVEFIRHIPFGTSGVGGRLIKGYFYATDQNKLMIYDTKNPEDPQLQGVLPMVDQPIFSREDVDTNGKILILPNQNGGGPNTCDTETRQCVVNKLYVIDVEDKTNPKVLATVPGAAQHTNSCILKCTYAYGSEGNIVDLRNPRKPKLLKEKWGDPDKPARNGHDVTEIAPGLVLTSTQPIMLLDARKDPVHPKVLAVGASKDGRFIHTGIWPRGGKDKFLLMAGETNFTVQCGDKNGAFMTWDASKWKKKHTFSMIDEYRMGNGTYIDGKPAHNAVGCSSHWHEANPKFHNGGLVAAAFFEHGTRFIKVSSKGKISETGYFMPHVGSTGAVYWVNDRVLYAMDYTRGIDVIKFTGKL